MAENGYLAAAIVLVAVTTDVHTYWKYQGPVVRDPVSEYALILASTVLVNNLVLDRLLGVCPFYAVSRKVETAIGLSCATLFILTLASASSYLVFTYLLVPLGIEYLRIIVFILVVAVVAQFTQWAIDAVSPSFYHLLGIFLPLAAVNCAVLGVALINLQEPHSFIQSCVYGFGAGLGFSIVLILFSSLRERLAVADVPRPFQGASIALVTLGLMSIAFMGFAGLVKG